jgi:adenylate cyclase
MFGFGTLAAIPIGTAFDVISSAIPTVIILVLLLHNVMPSSIAVRLHRGEIIADHFDEVTVVFADLVGFTTLSAGLPPRRVVAMLTEVFGEIDRIATEEGMEKVKTIGDCYLAVCGAPEPSTDHADRALRFATRVRDRVVGWNHYGTDLSVRIGVHSGPVMAGILGNKRILYDLWGDTVNAASRLESSGVPGEVQVSEPTVKLTSAKWELEDRGVVKLRG